MPVMVSGDAMAERPGFVAAFGVQNRFGSAIYLLDEAGRVVPLDEPLRDGFRQVVVETGSRPETRSVLELTIGNYAPVGGDFYFTKLYALDGERAPTPRSSGSIPGARSTMSLR